MWRHRRKLIYLLGFMGSGKSTVGALLARELGWPVIDLDTTIEAAQGKTIREIFERDGEAPFRDIERVVLTETSKTEPAVIALGGGTSVQPPNLDFTRSTGGVTLWLDCPLKELLRRCQTINNPPLFRDAANSAPLLAPRLPASHLA